MKQAIVKKGRVFCENIPAPVVSENGVLIKVINSCISAGTEMYWVEETGKSLIKRAMEQPENIKKVLNMVKNEGVINTLNKIKGKVESANPTGYSISGVVIGVGENIRNFSVGDRVAAAGAGLANHSEYVDVPENLVMKIPENLNFEKASTVTLGGIAMQGVRRADLRFGEFAVVVGAGILGLLSVQMLINSGVRVATIDLDEKRLEIAAKTGAELIINPIKDDQVKTVDNWTNGKGADAVIFTAATSSNEPLSKSFQMTRKKGKVILVGVSGMEIKREDIYTKEIDFLISTSYGPGRYDKIYEEKGIDYPYAYVRWTENRNMMEYLRMVNENKIDLESLIQKKYSIERCTEAFESLSNIECKPLMVLLDYGNFHTEKICDYFSHNRKVEFKSKKLDKKIINIAIIGTGGFAVGMHIPNILKLKNKYRIYAVMNRTGLKANTIAEKVNAEYSTTDFNDILKDENVDLVMICTRHDSHASLTLKALEAGKHVFVEKPLAVSQDELNEIVNFYKNDKNEKPMLFVGFNRRFSKYAEEIKKHTDKRINPLFIRYRMNAGYIPLDHWGHENGGRIVGECCHIIDLMTFFTESEIESISYENLNPKTDFLSKHDNKSIILKYKDGSVCGIDYFANGSNEFPKEYMEIHFDQKTIVLDDYKSLSGYGLKINKISSENSEKGQYEELKLIYDSIKNNKHLFELWDLIQTTQSTFYLE